MVRVSFGDQFHRCGFCVLWRKIQAKSCPTNNDNQNVQPVPGVSEVTQSGADDVANHVHGEDDEEKSGEHAETVGEVVPFYVDYEQSNGMGYVRRNNHAGWVEFK